MLNDVLPSFSRRQPASRYVINVRGESEKVLSVEQSLSKKEEKMSGSRFRPSVYKTRGWKKAGRAHKWGIEPSGSRLRSTTVRRHAPPRVL